MNKRMSSESTPLTGACVLAAAALCPERGRPPMTATTASSTAAAAGAAMSPDNRRLRLPEEIPASTQRSQACRRARCRTP